MIVYCTEPLDFWSGWQRPGDVFRLDVDGYGFSDRHTAQDWPLMWAKAKAMARSLGWEGDIRDGPYVTVLPDTGGGPCPVVIAWKQDNNGTCFVASPYPLPWFEKDVP